MTVPADPRQLPLDLPARQAMGREAFMVAPCNAAALARIDGWRDWPGGKLVLVGPAASGKTHLAHAWADETGAGVVEAGTLAGLDVQEAAVRPLVVEGAETVAGDAAGERALFHLHNLMQAGGQPLLLTARTVPQRWGLGLADLASRIEGTAVAQLDPPDDAALRAVLVKLFADRQLTPSPRLVDYLVNRMDRSFAAAREIVARLDAAALAQGGPVTMQMAARVLDDLD